jgi:hypothetical protein
MPLAVEYLIGARVLLLKIYGSLSANDVRDATDKVELHGCYFAGVPILVEVTDSPAIRLEGEVARLRATLRQRLPRSRVAFAWNPPDAGVLPWPDDEAPAFRTRAEALHWLRDDT